MIQVLFDPWETKKATDSRNELRDVVGFELRE